MNFGVVILPELTVRVGARGVEVPQRDPAHTMGALEVRERTLDRELRLAVAVDRLLRMRFCDRRLDRLAVGRAGRRKDEEGDRFGGHGLEDAEGAADVVAVVARRFADRFAHIEKGREMHHRLDLVSADRRPDCAGIQDVPFDQVAVTHGVAMARGQIVEHHRLVSGGRERLAGVAPDVTGAAGHQHAARLSAQWRRR